VTGRLIRAQPNKKMLKQRLKFLRQFGIQVLQGTNHRLI
jgi:hypothetical protein